MDGSNTTSSLKLVPTAKDHDAELICSAVNPLLAAGNGSEASSSGVETRRKLIVHCKKFSSSFFFPPLFPHVDVFLISSRTRQRARAGCVRGKQTQNAERAPPIFGSRTTESKVEGKRTSV